MDQTSLPVLPATMSLGLALGRMFAAGKSGFVTRIGGIPAVVDMKSLQQGGIDYSTPIGSIKPSQRSIMLPPALRNADGTTEASLDLHEASFGIGAISGGEAMVFTRHETFAMQLNVSSGYYRCRADPRHVFAPGTLFVDGECNEGDGLVDLVS